MARPMLDHWDAPETLDCELCDREVPAHELNDDNECLTCALDLTVCDTCEEPMTGLDREAFRRAKAEGVIARDAAPACRVCRGAN